MAEQAEGEKADSQEKNEEDDESVVRMLTITRPLTRNMTANQFEIFTLGVAVSLGLYIRADDRTRGFIAGAAE